MDKKSIESVKNFWENNPLFVGESKNEKGTKKFFEEHTKVYISDCFAGEFDQKTVPNNLKDKTVLDLGCGIGFWVVQLSKIYKYACLIKIENQVPAIITNKNKLNASDFKLYNSLTSSGFIILDKSILQERIEMDNSIVNRDQYIYSLLFCFSKKFPW